MGNTDSVHNDCKSLDQTSFDPKRLEVIEFRMTPCRVEFVFKNSEIRKLINYPKFDIWVDHGESWILLDRINDSKYYITGPNIEHNICFSINKGDAHVQIYLYRHWHTLLNTYKLTVENNTLILS